jgi:hypothetical protein
MEMPIQIIIVLFVAVVVGGAIIAFSQSTLSRAQQQLADKWRDDPALKNSIVEVSDATDNTIITLAQACYKMRSATPDASVCFALFAKTWSAHFPTLDNTNLGAEYGNYTLDTTGVTATEITAVKIRYDPLGKIRVATS